MKRKDDIWKSEARAKRFLDDIRPGLPWVEEQKEVMFRLIEARGEPINNFADLGCGGGMLAEFILEHYPQSAGTLVDFSSTMLKEAERKLADKSANSCFLLADLGDETWVDTVRYRSPFDLIVSGFCIHHQPDERKRKLYQEIYDLLKPGGFFIHMEHVASSTKWLETIFFDALTDSLHAFHSRRGTGKTQRQLLEEIMNSPERNANILTPVEIQCQWLRNIGFQDVDCYFKMFEVAVFGGRRPRI
jgi:tRNA (cmo5U34)-methyltransferase